MTRADSVHVPTNQGKSTVRILVAVAKKVNQDKHIRKPQVISGVGGGGAHPCTLPLDPPLLLNICLEYVEHRPG